MHNFHGCLFSCIKTAICRGCSWPSRRPRLPPGAPVPKIPHYLSCSDVDASVTVLHTFYFVSMIKHLQCCTIQRNGYHVNDNVRRRMWNDWPFLHVVMVNENFIHVVTERLTVLLRVQNQSLPSLWVSNITMCYTCTLKLYRTLSHTLKAVIHQNS